MPDTRQDIMHFFLRGYRIQTQIVFPELLTVSLVGGLNQAEKPYLFLNSIVIETTNNSVWLILADLLIQLQQASDTAPHLFNGDGWIVQERLPLLSNGCQQFTLEGLRNELPQLFFCCFIYVLGVQLIPLLLFFLHERTGRSQPPVGIERGKLSIAVHPAPIQLVVRRCSFEPPLFDIFKCIFCKHTIYSPSRMYVRQSFQEQLLCFLYSSQSKIEASTIHKVDPHFLPRLCVSSIGKALYFLKRFFIKKQCFLKTTKLHKYLGFLTIRGCQRGKIKMPLLF